jgi:hypothetical protein
MRVMPPASPFATGDQLVHLENGLARVVEIKHSAGTLHLVVAIGKQTVWIPLDAWREHVRALPTRAEADRWYARARTGALTPGGRAAADRRWRTIGHRDFAAKVAALADAYRCGDRDGRADATLGALEDHVLPIIGVVLGRPVAALRDELRAAMPEGVTPPQPAPLPSIGDRFEPIGRATFGKTTVAGDPGSRDVELATLPGEWLGYRWIAHPRDEFGRLIAIHADHVARLDALLAARVAVGSPNCDAASALVYDPAIVDDRAAVDEIYDPVEPGLIAGRGFSLSLGGDGPYDVSAAKHGARVACIVAGGTPSMLEDRLLRGEDRERVAIEELASWTPNEDHDYDPVPRAALAILGEPPASADKVAALERFVARLEPEDDLALEAIELLARLAPDPRPWFERLATAFERPAHGLAYAIARVLGATPRRDLGDLVLARLATDRPPWREARLTLLRALVRGGHPGAPAALRERLDGAITPWSRAQTAAVLLELEPESCANAQILIEDVENYGALDRSGDPLSAGVGNDWDELCEAMALHVSSCEACRVEWVTQLFRVKRTDDPELRRLVVIAPEQLAALTGAHDDTALWKWLAAHPK